MEGLSFYVGVIGNIISVLLFLSPIGTFVRIIRKRSTEEFESLPYICTLLNSALWTYYGIIRPGSYLVATVNGFGVLVEAVYVVLFLIFAPSKEKAAKTAVLLVVLDGGFLAAVVLVTHFAMQGDMRIDVLGFICAGLNIVMYGSPLASMKTVVTTKSVDYMPFFLSFFLFLNGGIWAFYALLVGDCFLGVPNGIGLLLGTAQLVLYTIYRNHPKASMSRLEGLEEGFQHHQPLICPSDPESLIQEQDQDQVQE